MAQIMHDKDQKELVCMGPEEYEKLRAELAEAKKERDMYQKAAVTLFYDGLLSPEMCAKLEDVEDAS